jgi:hypothetical protein
MRAMSPLDSYDTFNDNDAVCCSSILAQQIMKAKGSAGGFLRHGNVFRTQ